ncbi:MAG: LysM peptidoglycan-binding domain-containing protein [Verrucomicrobiota bacterium]
MALVEKYIESIRLGVEKQIYISIWELELSEEEVKRLEEGGLDVGIHPPKGAKVRPGRQSGFWSLEALLEELSRPPVVKEEEDPVQSWIAGVFTESQFQVTLRALKRVGNVEPVAIPSLMVRSGQPAMIQVGEKRYGVIALFGADEFSVDVAAFLPEHGKALFRPGDELQTHLRVLMWDGQIAAFSMRRKEGPIRMVFLRAELMDPAGERINPEGGAKAFRPKIQFEPTSPPVDLADTEDLLLIHEAQDFAATGSDAMKEGSYHLAVQWFEKALATLPKMELTEERRIIYAQKLKEAQLAASKKEIQNAPAQSAAVSAEGEKTLTTLLSSATTYQVREGDTLSRLAVRAKTSVAALRELIQLESNDLEVGQIIQVPVGKSEISSMEALLASTTIPTIDFQDLPMDEALGTVYRYLLDEKEKSSSAAPTPKVIFRGSNQFADLRITLRLSHVPAKEALRYITALARCRYEVDDSRILILPLTGIEE